MVTTVACRKTFRMFATGAKFFKGSRYYKSLNFALSLLVDVPYYPIAHIGATVVFADAFTLCSFCCHSDCVAAELLFKL